MNTADRFGFAHHNPSIAVPRSPSASATKMAVEIGREKQEEGNELRGEVTPASIRMSMPPIRDIEFEYLKKFQTDLFRIIVKAKSQGLYIAPFTVTSRDLDEYTLDFIFSKFVAVLRHQKFFVAIGDNLPRSFLVSWDPILCPESITPEELNNPNSNAAIRTRRYARLQKKSETLAAAERETSEKFKEYLQIMQEDAILAPNESISSINKTWNNWSQQPMPPTTTAQASAQQPKKSHAIEINSETKAKALLMQDMLNMSRMQTVPTEQHPLVPEPNQFSDEAISMIRAAEEVAGENGKNIENT